MRTFQISAWMVVFLTLLAAGWVMMRFDLSAFKTMIESWGVYGYLVYVGLLVASVVLAPFTVFPIIPFASSVFGPLTTGILTLIGWTVGAMSAFLLARYAGRPIIGRFADLSRADRIAASLPPRAQFLAIFIMRHLVPVEVLSYGLGLVPTVSFRMYAVATVLGLVWSSFAFAYLGEAAFTHNLQLLLALGLASLAVFIGGWYLLGRLRNTNT